MASDYSLWFKSPLDKTRSESDFMPCVSVCPMGRAKPGNSSSSSKERLLLLIEPLIQKDREIQLDLWFRWNIVISCELGTIGNHHNNFKPNGAYFSTKVFVGLYGVRMLYIYSILFLHF